jgi:stage III sporulation protein AD
MTGFFQAAAVVLITVVLCLTLGSQGKSFGNILSMAVCTIVLTMGLKYMEPVADFLKELQTLGNLSGEMITILLKTALIGMLTEICALLCSDGGNGSLAQALRMVGTAVILWLSLPIFRALLDLVQKILEGI